MDLDIRTPTTPAELDATRALIRAFVAWHRARHQQDLDLIDRYCDAAEFEEESRGEDRQLIAAARELLSALQSRR